VKGSKLALLLGGAAFAVGIQNYIFFSNLSDKPFVIADEDEDEALDWDDRERVALDPLDPSVIAKAVFGQSGEPRNPFLTAEEGRLLDGAGNEIAMGMPRVTGTLWSQGRRVAWIDGRPQSEGDWVNEYKILRIEPSRVALTRGEGESPMILSVARAPIAIEEDTDEQ